MNTSPDLFIFAGEHSGDLYGEKLVQTLHKINPKLRITGVGGPKMRKTGMKCLMPMEKFQVMGFFDIIAALPRIFFLFRKVKRLIKEKKPKAVLFIDYAEFNLKMARSLKKENVAIKMIHFICPSVWAWRKQRIYSMEKTLDLLLTILPFEKECFVGTSLDVKYVGHPLKHKIANYQYDKTWNDTLPSFEGKKLLSIFPGSRLKELKRNFKSQLKVAKEVANEEKNFMIAISCGAPKFFPIIQQFLMEQSLDNDPNVFIIKAQHSYELMKETNLAIATSGTVTLELALHHVPTVVTYAITKIDLFLAQKIFHINLPFYSLVNIIGQRSIYPELYGPNFTENNLYFELKKYLKDPIRKEDCVKNCLDIETLIGEKDATNTAAEKILELI